MNTWRSSKPSAVDVKGAHMPKKFRELADQVRADPRRARRVDAYKGGIEASLSLAELREEMERTQVALATALQVTQANVSRIEHSEDLMLSTLRGYVEALGGRIRVEAVFPGQEFELLLGPEEVAELVGRGSGT